MIGQVVVWIVIALVIAGLVAPNEALTWWRRGQQGRRGVEWPSLAEAFALPGGEPGEVPAQLPAETDHYLVYLSGIGISGPEQLPVFETPMVERLAARVGQ